MATIYNDNVNQMLLTVAHNTDTYDGLIWIGLYDDSNSWKWSMEDKEYYVDRETELTSWLPSQPNNRHSDQYCVVYVSGQMQLNDIPCQKTLPFVCYDGMSKYELFCIYKGDFDCDHAFVFETHFYT